MKADILLTSHELNIQSCIDLVMAPDCGGIDVFIGTVRNLTKGKRVVKLEFEAYEKMAVSEMRKLCDQAFENGPFSGLPCITVLAICRWEKCR